MRVKGISTMKKWNIKTFACIYIVTLLFSLSDKTANAKNEALTRAELCQMIVDYMVSGSIIA